MSKGQPCSRIATEPSPGPISAYSTFKTPAVTRFSGAKERVEGVCAYAELTQQGRPGATSAAAAPNNRRRPWSMCSSRLLAGNRAMLLVEVMFVLLDELWQRHPPALRKRALRRR